MSSHLVFYLYKMGHSTTQNAHLSLGRRVTYERSSASPLTIKAMARAHSNVALRVKDSNRTRAQGHTKAYRPYKKVGSPERHTGEGSTPVEVQAQRQYKCNHL